MRPVAAALAALCLTTASAVAASDLTAYEGKYPSDAVDGITFLANPAVVAGVAATLSDEGLRATVLGEETVQSPITVKDGVVRADDCEPHNCGDHNWSILVDAASPTGLNGILHQASQRGILVVSFDNKTIAAKVSRVLPLMKRSFACRRFARRSFFCALCFAN